jgi:hypothetical protein
MRKPILNPEEKQVLRKLVEVEGLLIVPEPHKLNLSRGAIVVACSDGDQMDDLIDDVRRLSAEQGMKPRPHLITEHGGAMVLSPDWHDPIRPGRARRIIEDIMDARDMKDIYTILLFCHAPCGKAGSCNVGVEVSISHLMKAKRVVKRLDSRFQVRCFKHVDWHDEAEHGEHRKETYFIPADRWYQRQEFAASVT